MIDHPLARNAGEGEDEGGCIHEDDGGEKGSAHPRDLARLPIRLKLQTISLAEGVRAALSVAVIFAAMEILGLPVLREAGLAALLTCICDPGGPIRRRVPVLLCFTAFGAVITVCGGLARAAGIGVALPFGVLAIFCASLARVYGEAPQRLGALLASVTILSLDYPLRDAQQAGALAGSFIGGGLWATLLTMVIWPVYPYRPVRRAVAQVYRTLASLAADLGDLARDPGSAAVWELHARTHRRAVRESVEAARTEIMMALRARGATSHRAVQSLIRLEAGDQIFGGLLGWSGLLEHETVERRASYRALRRLRPLLIRLANTIAADNAAEDTAVPAAIDRILAEAAM
ncbi:MAG: hypothetical protein JO227_18100, partial [Acetobacteraceae bacterium]|nr:hypothetical protein [Acetobacteraceae bacterium]